MCMISMIADYYGEKWAPPTYVVPITDRAEIDALRREVETMKELLRRAKLYDEQTGQPDCGKEEKIALLRKVAELVGVDLADIVGPPRSASNG